MEEIFNTIDYLDKDLNNKWNREYKSFFLNSLENDQVLKNKSNHLLSSLKIIINKLTLVTDRLNMDYIELEKYYVDIFKAVSNELNKDDIGYNNIEQFVDIFKLISSKHEAVTLFKIHSLCHLFFLLIERNYFELLNDTHIEILFMTMEIQITTEDYCYYEIKTQWKVSLR